MTKLLGKSHPLRWWKQCRHSSGIAASQFTVLLSERLAAIKEAGTWKEERIITSKQGPEISIQGSKKKILNFCANNYLGLSVSVELEIDRLTNYLTTGILTIINN